jgi:RHS repeat-associated protein
VISRVGSTTAASSGTGSTFAVPLPAGIQQNDQILLAVTGNDAYEPNGATGYSSVPPMSSGGLGVGWTATGGTPLTGGSFQLSLSSGVPAGVQILVAVNETVADSATVVDTVTGASYEQIATGASGATPGDAETVVFRRTATGNETSVTVSGSTGAQQSAVVAVYAGIDPNGPIDGIRTGGGDATKTLVVPSVPANSGEVVVLFQGAVGNTSPATWTPPAGLAERAQTSGPLRAVGVAETRLGQTTSTGKLTSTLNMTGAGANVAGVAITLRQIPLAFTQLYRRTATGGETEAVIDNVPAGAHLAAAAVVYRGVDPAYPLDAWTRAGIPNDPALVFTSLTPTASNDELVTFSGGLNDASLGTWTPPAGTTSRAQQTATQGQWNIALNVADQTRTGLTATGPLTAAVANNGGLGPNLAGHAVLLRPASAAKTVLFRRTVTGTDPAATITLSPGTTASAVLAVYRGADPVAPVDAFATAAGEANNTLSFPSLTSTVDGDKLLVIQGAFNSGGGTWTAPTGMTERAQSTATAERLYGITYAPTQVAVDSTGLAEQTLGAAGPTGTRATTINTGMPAADTDVAGIALLLRAQPGYGYDGNGNLTGIRGGALFSYDTGDRTTGISPPGGSPITFAYRGDGQTERASISPLQRVSGTCSTIAGCTPPTSTLGTTDTLENTALGVSAETIDGATTYYIRDPRGGLLAERTGTNTYYYRFDGQGSITGLLNTSGSVVATYSYDPYGQLTGISGGSVATNNPWRYIGAYEDGSGLYKMGARYYDPSLGRFTQQDPVFNPLDPKSWNRYIYVGDDPINFSDPDGDSILSWIRDKICGNKVVKGFIDFFSLKDPVAVAIQIVVGGASLTWYMTGGVLARGATAPASKYKTTVSIAGAIFGTLADIACGDG